MTIGMVFISMAAFAAGINYRVIDTTHLPGGIKWDYLTYDAGSHRLFITHGDAVDVFDTTEKKIVGTVTDTNGVHGVALAPDIGRGFTSNGKTNTVTIFGLSSFKPIGTVPTEKKPDAIVYDAATKRVFAANGESDSISVIDAVAGKNAGTISLDGKPEFEVVDGKGRLFVNLEDKNQIAAVDTQKLKVIANYNLAPDCEEPSGLSIDTEKERLFASCHNEKMVVVNGNDGKIMSVLPIGKGTDATSFDPGSHLAFSSNGDGTLTVIGDNEADKYKVQQVVKTLPTARTMALDPISHQIYLVAAEIDHVDQPTEQQPHPRPQLKADTFTLITVAP
jgi:YVTN family beta-propeller protein